MKTLIEPTSGSFRLHCEAASDVGRMRASNEDRFGVDEAHALFVVADGMGGHVAGEVAAQIVVDSLGAALGDARKNASPSEAALQEALERVSDSVFARSSENPEWSGMGTTAVALWIVDNQAYVAHLGDSRAYLWRDGSLRPLTRDHSLVELLLESGDISSEQAETHPMRHQITRFCGMKSTPTADVSRHELRASDLFLLASDGVTGELSDLALAQLLQKDATAQAIVSAAVEAGGRDNATAVIVRVSQEAFKSQS